MSIRIRATDWRIRRETLLHPGRPLQVWNDRIAQGGYAEVTAGPNEPALSDSPTVA